MAIVLPHKFVPRPYQIKIFDAVECGIKRFVWVVHRRGGKDKTFINIMATKIPQRLGNYYYYFPTLELGRRILWDGRDKAGFKFLEHFPRDMISKVNEKYMRITFTTGSAFQILGTDNLNVVGVNPIGCMFSEYAQQDPRVWDLIRPILAENEGWAGFNGTPRGKNHLYEMLQMAKDSDRWFSEVLTVDDTKAISATDINNERIDGMSEEMIQQEFYCNFEFGLEGSYYAKLMARAAVEGRIGDVRHNTSEGVFTAWDIGVNDANAIWFFQHVGSWVHAIDYYEMNNVGIDHYANIIHKKQNELGYNYIAHYAPHDIENREYSAEQAAKRIETAKKLGIHFIKIPRIRVKQDGIDTVRGLLPLVRFDKVKCKDGIKALYDYQKAYNFKYKIFANHPLRNWAKHGADAFECGAVAIKIHGNLSSDEMTAEEARELEDACAPRGAL